MTAGTRNLVLGLIIIFLILGAMAALIMASQRGTGTPTESTDTAADQTLGTAPDTTPAQTNPTDSASESTPSTLPTIR